MMAQSWFLKLISFLILLSFMVNAEITIESIETFETDLCDFDLDCTSCGLDTITKKEGSYSARWNWTDEGEDAGIMIWGPWSPPKDFSVYENFSFWYNLDTSKFTSFTGDLYFYCTSSDFTNLDSANSWQLGASALSPVNGWNYVTLNESNLTENGACDLSTVYGFAWELDGPATFPTPFYMDNFTGIRVDSCPPPASGDWTIIDGDKCTFNVTDTITGNLNISNGSLEIQDSGVLTISGGYGYVYPSSNLTLLSGGQLNG